MHIHIDQGVNFSKLAKKYQNSKVGKNYFWRTLVVFWLTVAVESLCSYTEPQQLLYFIGIIQCWFQI